MIKPGLSATSLLDRGLQLMGDNTRYRKWSRMTCLLIRY